MLATVAGVAALAASPARATAQGTFEGVVTFQMHAGPDGQQTMQYSVKGDKVRMDVSARGMQMFALFDGATKTMDMVIPMRQMYMERSAADAQAMVDSAVAASKIHWTGRKETIAGYECEHATFTDQKGQATDVCLAKGLGTFVPMGGGPGGRGRGAMSGGWESRIGQQFPLKVVQDGNVELLVTSVEKKPLDDSLFTIPAGYQKMEMPMGGRRGRGGR